jgi:DNA-binding transcriptional MerR regulator
MTERGLRIGEAAARAGVSCRTLRYYEELGLLLPSREGGGRRYSERDVARLMRIREMQELMGFGLDEIGLVLRSEDRLAELRDEYRSGPARGRQEAILAEAVEINDRLRSQVRGKMKKLEEVLAELDAKARRYRELSKKLSRASR